jgi:CRP-like cAMP-binding protein
MTGVETFAWTMRWEDWAGNFCYLILAFSYLVTNLYWLRLLAILALGLEGIYFYCASTPPLWVGIAWAAVFVAINLIQIALLTRERLKVQMSEPENLLHRGLFPEMTPMDFRRFLKAGHWREVAKDSLLTTEGKPVPDLLFITRGNARVARNGGAPMSLGPGTILGEKSFLCGGNASATIIAETALTVFAVNKLSLRALLQHDHRVASAIFSTMGRDMSAKLRTLIQERNYPPREVDDLNERSLVPNTRLLLVAGRDEDVVTVVSAGVKN